MLPPPPAASYRRRSKSAEVLEVTSETPPPLPKAKKCKGAPSCDTEERDSQKETAEEPDTEEPASQKASSKRARRPSVGKCAPPDPPPELASKRAAKKPKLAATEPQPASQNLADAVLLDDDEDDQPLSLACRKTLPDNQLPDNQLPDNQPAAGSDVSRQHLNRLGTVCGTSVDREIFVGAMYDKSIIEGPIPSPPRKRRWTTHGQFVFYPHTGRADDR